MVIVMVVALVPMEVNNCGRLVFLAHQNTVYYPEHHHLCRRGRVGEREGGRRGGWGKGRVHVHYQLYRLAYLAATESRQTDWGAHINNKWYNEDHNGYPEVFVSW